MYPNDRLFTLNGLYDAAESKRVIGCFDALISGRIHGAVQGLSQGIPTAIIDMAMNREPIKLSGLRTFMEPEITF